MTLKNVAMAVAFYGSVFAGSVSAQTTFAGGPDSVLTTEVQQAISGHPALSGGRIHVQSRSGVVYLSGIVDTDAEAAMAESIALSIGGVQKVVNSTSAAGGN